MAAITFPSSPTTNQPYGTGSSAWNWDGSAWRVVRNLDVDVGLGFSAINCGSASVNDTVFTTGVLSGLVDQRSSQVLNKKVLAAPLLLSPTLNTATLNTATLNTATLNTATLVAPILGTPASGNLSNCTVDGTNSIGFLDIPQNTESSDYTLVLSDAGKHIFHPSADTTARTFTIPANSSVAFPIGTAVTFVNQNAAGVVTIAITTDTMRLAGAGTTGSRTLAANGVATAIKITSTEWIISGTGLT